MAARQINITNISTAYTAYGTAKTNLATAVATEASTLAAKPVHPDSVATAAAYNDISDDIDDWQVTMVAATEDRKSKQTIRDAAYQTLVGLMPTELNVGVKIGSSPEKWIVIETVGGEPLESSTDPNP